MAVGWAALAIWVWRNVAVNVVAVTEVTSTVPVYTHWFTRFGNGGGLQSAIAKTEPGCMHHGTPLGLRPYMRLGVMILLAGSGGTLVTAVMVIGAELGGGGGGVGRSAPGASK